MGGSLETSSQSSHGYTDSPGNDGFEQVIDSIQAHPLFTKHSLITIEIKEFI